MEKVWKWVYQKDHFFCVVFQQIDQSINQSIDEFVIAWLSTFVALRHDSNWVSFFPDLPITNIAKNETIFSKENGPISISCTVRAFPPADKVRWYRNEKMIFEDRMKMTSPGANETKNGESLAVKNEVQTNALRILQMSRGDVGSYSCEAHNSAGWSTRSNSVDVKIPCKLFMAFLDKNFFYDLFLEWNFFWIQFSNLKEFFDSILELKRIFWFNSSIWKNFLDSIIKFKEFFGFNSQI